MPGLAKVKLNLYPHSKNPIFQFIVPSIAPSNEAATATVSIVGTSMDTEVVLVVFIYESTVITY